MNKQTGHIEDTVKQVLTGHGVLNRECLLVAAFSGGGDSMTLLHVLRNLRENEIFPLAAVYIHHGLRKEADEEEKMLSDLCRDWDVSFFCAHVDVEGRVKATKESVEEAARILRYQALDTIAQQEMHRGGWKEYRILTAHHADDQAETILMNLIRGTSLTGLTGMKEQSGRILRPLLRISKKEIYEYLEVHRLFHVEDASNQELIYRRNRIRKELIPFLQELNPRITDTLNTMSRILGEDEAYLEEQMKRAWEICRREDPEIWGQDAIEVKEASALPRSIRLRVLRHFLSLQGGLKDITEVQMNILDRFLGASEGKRIDLTGRQILMKKGLLVVRRDSAEKKKQNEKESENTEKESRQAQIIEKMKPISLGPEDFGRWIETPQGNLRLTLEENPGNRIREISAGNYTKWFSCDIITENLCLRVREPGDFLSLRRGRQSLQDLMVNQKIPRDSRDRMILMMKGKECVWIIGSRCSEKFWVSPEDPKAIKAEWHPIEEVHSAGSGDREEQSEKSDR